MFKTITRLIFGGEEQPAPEDVKPGDEGEEEEWLVVSHQGRSQSVLFVYLELHSNIECLRF